MKPEFFDVKTKYATWTFDKLKSCPPFQKNRDVLPRVKKLTKILSSEYSPTQLEYKVGLAVKPFGKYKKGEMFVLDGNTRTEVYKKRADLIPPFPLKVTIYELDNIEQAEKVYYSVDSATAAETSSEKVTGVHRERDFNAISKVIKKGNYNTALKIACRYAENENGLYLQSATFEDRLDYFWDEIMFIDGYNLDMYKRMSISVLGSLLMVIKKYGTDNPNVDKLLRAFRSGTTTVNDNNEVDGVHYIYNDFYAEKSSMWSQSSYGKSPELVCPILYSFDLFVNNVTIKKKKEQKLILPNKENLRELYQFYLD
jgi:hypothetical protein